MNLRILLSVFTIFGVVALAGTGAYAAFSSQATNTGNTFGTGTLNLVINPNASPFPSPVFSVVGAKPGDTFNQIINLQNTGTINASSVKVSGFGLAGNSELAGVLTMQFYDDVDSSGTFNAGDTSLGNAHLDAGVWTGYTLPGIAIPAGTTRKVGALLTFDTSADDSYQNKSMTFTIGFQANQ